MTPFQRDVRAAVYAAFVAGVREVGPDALAEEHGWDMGDVAAALAQLEGDHRIALTEDGNVMMAHPFSGVATPYRAVVGEAWWHANCAWDALAILALLGDGHAEGPDGLRWVVSKGVVEPNGIVHLLVPARRFWEDVGFT